LRRGRRNPNTTDVGRRFALRAKLLESIPAIMGVFVKVDKTTVFDKGI
jgi:hypothetical protein